MVGYGVESWAWRACYIICLVNHRCGVRALYTDSHLALELDAA